MRLLTFSNSLGDSRQKISASTETQLSKNGISKESSLINDKKDKKVIMKASLEIELAELNVQFLSP